MPAMLTTDSRQGVVPASTPDRLATASFCRHSVPEVSVYWMRTTVGRLLLSCFVIRSVPAMMSLSSSVATDADALSGTR